MQRTAKLIYNEITQARKILLVSHQNPDGDALGSLSSFSYFLKNINKPHNVYCLTPAPPKLLALPHLVEINTDTELWHTKNGHDLIIVLDSGDLRYAGVHELIKNLTHDFKIINIDHHISNVNFGHQNLVIPEASSTTEVLYYFFRYNNVEIDRNIALSLLTGLITDTDNFTNGATSSSSLKIASDLIHRGANFNSIKTWFLQDKTIPKLKVWGAVLSRLNKQEEHDIVYTFIRQQDLRENGVDESEIEGIANFMNNLGDGRASLILKELNENSTKGSFRTTRDDTDVSAWAKALGGGGHKKAAGFTVEADIDKTLEMVWKVIANSQSVL
jgi:phosphoesterase RecJ-like protein